MFRSAEATVNTGTRAVFVAITPCRLFDTRPAPLNVGSRTAPLTAADTFTVPVRGTNGNCTIPAGAVGVVMNVTIDNPTADSFLTVYPAAPAGNQIVSVGTGNGSACNPLFDATHDAVPVYVVTTTGVYVDQNFTIVIPAP